MTEFTQQLAGAAWEVAGRRVASSLDGVSAALVLGDDPASAASAALGAARPQAARRRVVVADLVGEVAPLQELVSDDDAHGISDSFQFGVSLNRVAHEVDEAGSLYVMPSGSEPVITDEVLRSDRWGPLVDAVRKSGGLLLLVAPAEAPGLASLARFVDGVMLAGDASPDFLGDLRVLARVATPPESASPTPTSSESPLLAPEPLAAARPRPTPPPPAAVSGPRSKTPLVVGGALVAAAAAWFAFAGGEPEDAAAPAPPIAEVAPAAAARPRPDDPRDTATVPPAAAARPAAAPAGLLVVNPGDSARAARFAVLISTFPSAERARARLEQDGPSVAAATIVPAPVTPRFEYVAGAYAARADAELLLARLRRRSAVGSRGGSVVDRPLAFLLREGVPRDSVAPAARALRQRRLAAYALLQPDGSARLYAGAYANAGEAAAAAGVLRAAGVEPTLAYRTGTAQ